MSKEIHLYTVLCIFSRKRVDFMRETVDYTRKDNDYSCKTAIYDTKGIVLAISYFSVFIIDSL